MSYVLPVQHDKRTEKNRTHMCHMSYLYDMIKEQKKYLNYISHTLTMLKNQHKSRVREVREREKNFFFSIVEENLYAILS